MNKSKLYSGIILLSIVLLSSSCTYNTMVELNEEVSSQWANVESAYQRRSDLIPNLLETVKGAADSEKNILTEVMQARAKATSISIDPSNITPQQIQAFQQNQAGLSGALSKLMVTVERYPNIKSNQNFQDFQKQLEGTENRINVERNKFNRIVKRYNATIKKFPTNLYASMAGFESKSYFQAEEGSQKAPKVSF